MNINKNARNNNNGGPPDDWPEEPVRPQTAPEEGQSAPPGGEGLGEEQERPEQLDDERLAELAAKMNELEERVIQAENRARENWDRLVRLQADFENYRKRTLREREDLLKFAGEQVITELLPVLDNFERALAAGRESPGDFYAGVEMIYRQLSDVLKAQGLAPVPALGEKFDPCRHEAVGWEQAIDTDQDNTVTKEFRKGYCLQEKVIRPAMVVVARAKTNEEQEGEEIDGEGYRH